jgi:arsenite methyltransferase
MAELTATDATASSCCAPEAQATCCAPSVKAECCDPRHGKHCECSAGKGGRRDRTICAP